jgi:hypothetical protein
MASASSSSSVNQVGFFLLLSFSQTLFPDVFLFLSVQTVMLLRRLFRASMPLAQIGQTAHPGNNIVSVW